MRNSSIPPHSLFIIVLTLVTSVSCSVLANPDETATSDGNPTITPIAISASEIAKPTPSIPPTDTPMIAAPTYSRSSKLIEELSTTTQNITINSNRYNEDVVSNWLTAWLNSLMQPSTQSPLRLESFSIEEIYNLNYSQYPLLPPVRTIISINPADDANSLWLYEGTALQENDKVYSLGLVLEFAFNENDMYLSSLSLGIPYILQIKNSELENLTEEEIVIHALTFWFDLQTIEDVHIYERLTEYKIESLALRPGDGNEANYLVTFSVHPLEPAKSRWNQFFGGTYSRDTGWINGATLFISYTRLDQITEFTISIP